MVVSVIPFTPARAGRIDYSGYLHRRGHIGYDGGSGYSGYAPRRGHADYIGDTDDVDCNDCNDCND